MILCIKPGKIFQRPHSQLYCHGPAQSHDCLGSYPEKTANKIKVIRLADHEISPV